MKFDRRIFSNLILFVVLIALTAVFTMCSSTSTIKIAFGDDLMGISAKGYGMNITYADVRSVELIDAPDFGHTTDEGKNRPELQSGIWENDTWGEYDLCFNPKGTTCIVTHLQNGRVCVFNNNTDEKTAALYQEFLTYLPEAAAE